MHPHSPPEVKVSLHKSPAGHSVLPLCCYQRHICYWLCISPVHEHRVQRSVWAWDPPFKALEVCNNKALALTCFIQFPSLWHREGGGASPFMHSFANSVRCKQRYPSLALLYGCLHHHATGGPASSSSRAGEEKTCIINRGGGEVAACLLACACALT